MPERLTPFAFEEQLVRCRLDERGEPWFVAKDVALALGYQWAGIRNVQHIPEEWRLVESVSTSFGDKQTWFLSEQGLYFFVARSDKPRALPFQKWLAGEVLPSLRFADEECRRDAGGRVNASRLYEAFALWWCARFADTVPAIHVFGRVMPARFAKVKRGGKTWYLGLSLTDQAR